MARIPRICSRIYILTQRRKGAKRETEFARIVPSLRGISRRPRLPEKTESEIDVRALCLGLRKQGGCFVLMPTQGIAGLILLCAFAALREANFPSCGLCARIFRAKFVNGLYFSETAKANRDWSNFGSPEPCHAARVLPWAVPSAFTWQTISNRKGLPGLTPAASSGTRSERE